MARYAAIIGTVGEAFWIDRFPVTNGQFCEFLNDCGNRKVQRICILLKADNPGANDQHASFVLERAVPVIAASCA